MHTKVAVFLIIALINHASAFVYTDCGSKVGKITSLEISNCPNNTEDRCVLKRNTNATLEIGFTSNVDSDVLKAVVHGIILDIPTPFPLPNPDGCKDSNIQCPIKNGETYKYTTMLPVSHLYPRLSVDVKWELQDKNGEDIICALIPAKIQ